MNLHNWDIHSINSRDTAARYIDIHTHITLHYMLLSNETLFSLQRLFTLSAFSIRNSGCSHLPSYNRVYVLCIWSYYIDLSLFKISQRFEFEYRWDNLISETSDNHNGFHSLTICPFLWIVSVTKSISICTEDYIELRNCKEVIWL